MRTNADLGLLIQRVSIAGMLLMMHGWEKLVILGNRANEN